LKFTQGSDSADKESVERNMEPLLKAKQPVMVSSCGLMNLPAVAGRIIDVSPKVLRLRLPHPIPCGSPVRIETDDMIARGEVKRCRYDFDSYVVSLMLFQRAPSHRSA
jgi:hypothetical protein